MNRFAALIDRLATAGDEEMKHRLLADYFAATPEPDHSVAAGILAAEPKKRGRVKLALVRSLAESRLDPVLFALSLDYVGDVAETIALLWPPQGRANKDPSLSDVVVALSSLGRSELPKRIEAWLDASDATGRWALIKLVTGTLNPPTASFARQNKDAASQGEMFATAASVPAAGTIDAVLLYAQRGKSKNSPTVCTVGLWRGDLLVPVGRVSIAAGEERERIEEFVRDNTANRFGPVREAIHTRQVGLVLEIAFEDLDHAPRRKAGVVLRAIRINRVRADKPPGDAATIEMLENLLSPAQIR